MKKLIFVLAVMSMIAGCGGGSVSVQVAQNESLPVVTSPVQKDVEVVPGELIVKFNSSADASAIASTHKMVGKSVGSAASEVIQHFDSINTSHIKVPAGMTDSEATKMYLNSGKVDYVEPNTVVNINSIPNDVYYKNSEWNMPMISAPAAWDKTNGSANVIIGVIDTGIEPTHPDLKNNWSGYWFNAITNSSTTPIDDNGHGTHVAGIIGAQGNNSAGVAGVNWTSKIAACKFINSAGSGTTANAIACVNYFNGLKSKGVNIVAVNSSWGSTAYSQALSDAMAAEPRILHVVASGNVASDNDKSPNYPGSLQLSNLISVAATTSTDAIASYSDYGRHTVSLGAPGDVILSTIPGATYGIKSGTSMAAPHVAGAIGLINSLNPAITAAAARNLILTSGDLNVGLNGKSVTSKRLNVSSALSCGSKPLFSLAKIPAALTVGTPATFTILSANCDQAVGPITVTLSSQNRTYTVQNADGLATFTFTPTSSTDTLKFSSAAGSDMVTIAPPTITSSIATTYTVGQSVNAQLTSAGGTMPYTFSASSLPTGLSITAAGKISGTTTTAGTWNASISITDAKNVQVIKTVTLTVNSAPKITTTLAQGQATVAYSQTLTVTGGTAPFTWSTSSVVPGLSISGSTLSGKPTTAGVTPYFNLTVVDANGVSATASVSLVILTAPVVVTSPSVTTVFPSSFTNGQILSLQLSGTGGTAPYRFSGSVPQGLSMSLSGLITGTVTGTGVVNANIAITDAKNVMVVKTVPFNILFPPTFDTTAIAAKVGVAYSKTFTPSGGAAPYTFSTVTVTPGVTLSPSGVFSGTPTVGYGYNVQVKITDANGVSATKSYLYLVSK